MENKKTFGEYIQLKRKEAGLTQKGFAEQLYVTESAVSKWERGLSYPDISLIRDICAVLHVTEHELLTASEDTTARRNEKLAQRYLRLLRRLQIVQIVLYGAAVLTCFICNLAIDRTLSWFFIVLTAVMLGASLTLLPVFVRRNKALITLGASTAALMLLLLVCAIYTGGDWFLLTAVSVLFGLCVVFLPFVLRGVWLPEPLQEHKALICAAVDTLLLFALLWIINWTLHGDWFFSTALPITVFALVPAWGTLLIARYMRANGYLKSAACLALWGGVLFVADGFMDMLLLGTPMRFGWAFDFARWNINTVDANVQMLVFVLLAGLAVVFALTGLFAAVQNKKAKA